MLLEKLERVRKRIEKPENWTQRTCARRADGSVCESRDKEACSWCLAGAIYVETGEDFYEVFNCIRLYTPNRDPVSFNDRHTHEQVLNILDQAIEGEKNAA